MSPFESAEELAEHALENQSDGNDSVRAAITYLSGDIYEVAVGLGLQKKVIEFLRSLKGIQYLQVQVEYFGS